ncbi:F-box/FBD/LRR-repeat protein-like protein [Tanacetum coccineum]
MWGSRRSRPVAGSKDAAPQNLNDFHSSVLKDLSDFPAKNSSNKYAREEFLKKGPIQRKLWPKNISARYLICKPSTDEESLQGWGVGKEDGQELLSMAPEAPQSNGCGSTSSRDMDRLSNLPSGIIELILCRVPQEAGRTSILSKEWRYRWTRIPNLVFIEDTFQVSTVDGAESSILDQSDYRSYLGFHNLSHYCKLLQDIHDPWISGSIGGPTISEIFECLPVIETFSIPLELIRVFRNIAIHKVPRELSTTLIHLKYLHIDGVYFFSKTELSVLALLIKSSPNLEKLKARVWDNSNFEISKIKYCFRVEDYSDIMLERLIELEITSFINAKNQLDFVRLILARSPVMKKVRIFPHYKIPKKEKLKIKSQILGDSISYPYASPDVQIIVAG